MQDLGLPGPDDKPRTKDRRLLTLESAALRQENQIGEIWKRISELSDRLAALEARMPKPHNFGGILSTGQPRSEVLAQEIKREKVQAQRKAKPEPQRMWVLTWGQFIFTRLSGFIERKDAARQHDVMFFDCEKDIEVVERALSIAAVMTNREETEVVERDGRLVEARFAGAE